MNFLKTATVSAALLCTSFPALASPDVWSDIEVKADLSAFDSSNALEYWPSLETDLSTALAELVEIKQGSEAPELRVVITKVAIDGSVELSDTGAFNEIEGNIVIIGDGEPTSDHNEVASTNVPEQSFSLRVYAQLEEGQVPPEGYILVPPSKDDLYETLVDAYAKEVVDYLEK